MASVPGSDRPTEERFWRCATPSEENLAALTAEGILLYRVAEARLEAVEREVAGGAAVRAVLGEPDYPVTYAQIARVFQIREQPRAVLELQNAKFGQVEVAFPDVARRDAFCFALQERLGPEWEHTEKDDRAWKTPVLLM